MALTMGTKRYTLADAATKLGVTHSALRWAANRGTLAPVEKYGKVWIVTEAALERYRREHLGQRGPKPGRNRS